MDIGIDCSCVAKPERTGVARYCASLVEALPAAIGAEDHVSLLYRISRWRKRQWFLKPNDRRFSTGVFHDRLVPFGAGGVDVIHGADLRIPRLRRIPAVSTVHDLSSLDVPGIADERFQRRKLLALADVAERASVILCISEFTEKALLARFPHAAGRTRVVPLGLPSRFGPQAKETIDRVLAARGLRRPYLLFVGQIAARKNLSPLLAALRILRGRATSRDVALVLAGPVQTGGDEIVAAARNSADAAAIHLTGFLGDDELPALYAGAAAFVFPGKAEGFGIPILEAMACGAPVVIARAGANPGTAGEAAVAVDPDSAEEFASAIERVVADTATRADLVARGHRRAAEFTWAETARRTVQAYRDALRIGVPV